MDFVERIFGFSPDNGSGSFEAAIILAATAVIAAAIWTWRRRDRRARHK